MEWTKDGMMWLASLTSWSLEVLASPPGWIGLAIVREQRTKLTGVGSDSRCVSPNHNHVYLNPVHVTSSLHHQIDQMFLLFKMVQNLLRVNVSGNVWVWAGANGITLYIMLYTHARHSTWREKGDRHGWTLVVPLSPYSHLHPNQ